MSRNTQRYPPWYGVEVARIYRMYVVVVVVVVARCESVSGAYELLGGSAAQV